MYIIIVGLSLMALSVLFTLAWARSRAIGRDANDDEGIPDEVPPEPAVIPTV